MNYVKVCSRIRPSSSDVNSSIITHDPSCDKPILSIGNLQFPMDYVFGSNALQSEVFDVVAKPLLCDCFNGFNASLFTYGQTGSGKSYTVFGGLDNTCFEDFDDRGIIPRLSDSLFSMKENLDQGISCVVKLSILEIYQEKLKDLLRSSNNNARDTQLRIREPAKGFVWVEGLTTQLIENKETFMQLVGSAMNKRIVGSHSMNNTSSRSHVCCIIEINQLNIINGEKISSKFHIIDLAGSEMVRKTDATGTRFEEAKHINKSLSALGNVIFALSSLSNINYSTITATSTPKLSHIPYRDSKLTRLLQNSLEGNAKTVIILTLSADPIHMAETISTLKFGERARKIQTSVTINKESLGSDQFDKIKQQLASAQNEIKRLKETIVELQEEFLMLKNNKNDEFDSLDSGTSKELDMPFKHVQREMICEICKKFMTDEVEKIQWMVETSRELHDEIEKEKALGEEGVGVVGRAGGMLVDVKTNDSLMDAGTETVEETAGTDHDEDDILEGTTLFNKSDRCAICGLNDEESDQLRIETNEVLGELFTCDGNCGDIFHVRCVGLIGDAGQFSIPDGEWLCTRCVLNEDQEKIKEASEGVRERSESVTNAADRIHGQKLSTSDRGSKEAFTGNSDLDRIAIQNASSMIATVKTEYHKMRKERNRILAHWQQEKRIQNKIENKRLKEQELSDEALLHARDEVQRLHSQLEWSLTENARMRSLFENMLADLQSQSNHELRSKTKPFYNTRNGTVSSHQPMDPASVWASVSLESLRGFLDNVMTKSQSLEEKGNPHSLSDYQGDQQGQVGSYGISSDFDEQEIPLKNDANFHDNVESRKFQGNSSPYELKSHPKLKSGNMVSNGIYTNDDDNNTTPIPTPWIKSTEKPSTILLSKSMRDNDYHHNKIKNESFPVSKSMSNLHLDREDSHNNQPIRSYEIKSKPIELNVNCHMGDNITNNNTFEETFEKEKLKFINPLRNRLNDLLKSVQDETGSYADIRLKYKTREESRIHNGKYLNK